MNPSVVPSYVLTGERILAQHRQRLEELQRTGHDCERALQLLHVFEAIMAQTYASLDHIRACAALLEPSMDPSPPPPTPIPQDAEHMGAVNHTHFYKHGGIVWSFDGRTWSSICFTHEWFMRGESQSIAAQTAQQHAA